MSEINEMKEALEELLKTEFNNYSDYRWAYTDKHDKEIEVDIFFREKLMNSLVFKSEKTSNGYAIFIEMGEDCFEEINWWDTSIKYFWMKLLENGFPK